MDTEFSKLEMFDLYLHDDNGRLHCVFSSVEINDVRSAAHSYDRQFGAYFKYWTICRSLGVPDPTLDLIVAEKYWPMTEMMLAGMKERQDVFA